MAGLRGHAPWRWLKRLGRAKNSDPSGPPRQAQPHSSGRKARHLTRGRGRSRGTPRWRIALVCTSALILVAAIGLLGRLALTGHPSPELAIKDRRPEQQAECEQLVKNKLLHPASYRLTSRFAETADDGAQRTFAWTFTSRTGDGSTGKGSAVCRASNHLPMASIEVRQVN